MSESLLERARRALNEERAEDAQAILINVIVREPDQDEAWLLLAEALSDPGKKRECLERARAINPRNVAITRALERLNTAAVKPAEGGPSASVAAPPVTLEPPREDPPAPKPPTAAPSKGSLVPLLDAAEQLAQTLLLTVEAPDIQQIGSSLLKTLDEAAALDPVQTRRWSRSAGRGALFKYEKALSASIAGLLRDDPRLPGLRERRQHALDYLR